MLDVAFARVPFDLRTSRVDDGAIAPRQTITACCRPVGPQIWAPVEPRSVVVIHKAGVRVESAKSSVLLVDLVYNHPLDGKPALVGEELGAFAVISAIAVYLAI